MKKEYIAPAVEIIVIEAPVNTLTEQLSQNKEGSAVLLSWLIGE